MLGNENIHLRRLEKADLGRLWEWHEEEGLYLFESISPHVSWDDIHDNFYSHFAWKGDFVIENKTGEITGICSYQNINWKNRSCSMSFQFPSGCDDYKSSIAVVNIIVSFVFSSLNLEKIDTHVLETADFAITTFLKTGFSREGILREHKFINGIYQDGHVFSLLRKDYDSKC